ncbi:MAG: hypothetical protein WCP52_02130 [Bacteroidota bacterium]
MKLKYIFISLKIRNGEYEYTSISVNQISSRKSTEKFGRDYAMNFYGEKPFQFTPGEQWYYFHGGSVAVKLTTVEEISKEEYDVLDKFQFR